MNYESAAKAMIRQYWHDSRAAKTTLSDEECISHIAAEAHHLVARHYGFHSIEEMDAAMVQHAGKWQDYMDRRSKHLPIRRG